MKFTAEERKIIDRLLEESDEMQRQPDSRYYTTEEVWETLMEVHNRIIHSNINKNINY
jgi:hypothetical protein